MATWSVLCKSLLKNAVEGGKAAAPHIMTFSKMALPHIKSAGTAVVHTAKSGVKFAAAHPKTGVAGLAIALPIVGYKKGLVNFAAEKVFGKGNEGKGLIEPASTALLGSHKDAYGNEKPVSEKTVDTLLGDGTYSSLKTGVGNVGAEGADVALLGSHKDAYGNEKPVSEKTVDTLLGDGTYSSLKTGVGNVGAEGADVYYRLKDTIGNVGAEGADVYHQLKGTLGNVGSEAGNLYYDGKEYVGGMFNGNGMVNGNVGAEGADVYHQLKGTLGNVGSEAGNLYYDGKEYVGGMFNGNGMVNHGNGYYDPTTAQYPSMSAVQGVQGQSGMGGGLMNNINSALSNVTGGNISKMNHASLLLASYMMFGRFGWLSKIAGLALGGMTMKNVNQRSVHNQEQQMNLPMQAAAAPQVATTPAPEEEHSMTVHRGR